MVYLKNLPLWERSLRISLGVAVSAYAIFNIGGIWGLVITICGLGAALTGIFGFCPACALAGRRLEKSARERQLSS